MCYSAQLHQDYREYVREHGASLDIHEFARLFWRRDREGKWVKIPKAMEAAFLASDEFPEITELIRKHSARSIESLEQDLFAQKRRLANAERKLATKPTKTAANEQRIAGNKIEQIKGWLGDLKRQEAKPKDSRIYPGSYALVMVVEDGKRLIKPMRYQCLPAGKPAAFDKKLPGTYNARRDSLDGYWKDVFGYSHGLVIADAFYEHVDRDGEDVVLEFRPDTGAPMLVACLWSRWQGKDEQLDGLLSFAAITDEPPAEVAAAGHDRCIIPIKGEHVDAWLNPDPSDLASQYAILDDRERPYYEHRLAA